MQVFTVRSSSTIIKLAVLWLANSDSSVISMTAAEEGAVRSCRLGIRKFVSQSQLEFISDTRWRLPEICQSVTAFIAASPWGGFSVSGTICRLPGCKIPVQQWLVPTPSMLRTTSLRQRSRRSWAHQADGSYHPSLWISFRRASVGWSDERNSWSHARSRQFCTTLQPRYSVGLLGPITIVKIVETVYENPAFWCILYMKCFLH